MKSIPRLFAELTAVIEDMHGIAVEGQAPHLSPDLRNMLLRSLNQSVARIELITSAIERRLVQSL